MSTPQSTKTASEDARVLALLDAALALQEAGETEQALGLLQRALTQQPRNSTVHLLIGIAYREQGEVAKAESSLHQAIQYDENNVKAHEALGLLLFGQGRTDEAINELIAGTKKGSPDPEILRTLGKAHQREGRSQEADALLRNQWLNTSDPAIGLVYGRFFIRDKRLEDASAIFQDLIERAPHLPRPRAELAYVLFLQDKYEAAGEQLQQLIKLFPQYDRGWRSLAQLYVSVNEPERAIDAADHALAIDATHFRNWLAKAEALKALGRFDEALISAQAGLDCGASDDVDAGIVLFQLNMIQVDALLSTGNADRAIEAIHNIQRDFPHVSGLEAYLVRILIMLGRHQEALTVLDEAISSGTVQIDAAVPLRYEVLHRLGKADDALAFISPHLDENRERIAYLDMIATQLYFQDQVAIARTMMEQIVEFAPEFVPMSANLGYLLVGEGEYDRARQYLTRVIAAPTDDHQALITTGNLGYLELLEGNYEAAQSLLSRIGNISDQDTSATQRVAYWLNGSLSPGYARHPMRTLPVPAAAKANLITTLLALGDNGAAESMGHELRDDLPDSSLPYEMIGTIYLAQNDQSNAHSAWETARTLSNDPLLTDEIDRWLNVLAI